MGEDVKEKIRSFLKDVEPNNEKEDADLNMNISGTGNIQAAGDVTIEINDPDNIIISGPNIIDCPDCGGKVSRRAEACNRCGCPVKRHFQKIGLKRAIKYLSIVFVLLLLLISILPKPYDTVVSLFVLVTMALLAGGLRELNKFDDV